MTIKYLKKATKTASTDDTKTKEIVQNLLKELLLFMENMGHISKEII